MKGKRLPTFVFTPCPGCGRRVLAVRDSSERTRVNFECHGCGDSGFVTHKGKK